MSIIGRLVRIPLRAGKRTLVEWRQELRQIRSPSKLRGYDKLQLGAGPNPLPGWANIDLTGDNIRWDLTRALPLQQASIRLIYSEHFIEHVTRDQALAILQNCHAAMQAHGLIRVSTPDVRSLAQAYLDERIVEMPHGGWYPRSPCAMLNEGMRLWGHEYLYDEPELTDLLREAGFRAIRRMKWGQSSNDELVGLETRPDFGDLILEATA